MQLQRRIDSRVLVFPAKFFWIARQHGHTCTELQLAIGVEKAANQPLAKEAGTAGDKYPRATKPFHVLSDEL